MKSVVLVAIAIAANAVNLALAMWLIGSTNLDPPSIGGVTDYLAAGVGIWCLGSALDVDRKLAEALDD